MHWLFLLALCLLGFAIGANAHAAVVAPPTNAQFDYQIGGAYTPLTSVGVIDRDRHDPIVAGKYNVCYVNAFQTQEDETRWWKVNHPDLLLRRADGTYVKDSGWNEVLLDIKKRTALLSVVGPWIDGCAASGYAGIEPDNLDSWTRSHGLLTKADAIAYAQLLAQRAHADGLAIAQKNTTELGSSGKTQVGFDFAIAEECQRYSECDAYTGVYGNQVVEIEYADTPFQSACAARGATISIIRRDVDVVPAGDPGYAYRWC